jgi:hypothetical protein
MQILLSPLKEYKGSETTVISGEYNYKNTMIQAKHRSTELVRCKKQYHEVCDDAVVHYEKLVAFP